MKFNKFMGIMSLVLSFVFFILMVGFIGGIERDAISFVAGTVGSLTALVLWVGSMFATDIFLSGGF